MKELYDVSSREMAELMTKRYSTSFSLGVRLLSRDVRQDIYTIYGFVRLADEIVDTFHGYDNAKLFADFLVDYQKSLDDGISTNPILHAFQEIVLKYNLQSLVDRFLNSMRMDLDKKTYDADQLDVYVDGSAVAVGLMCLKIFVKGDEMRYADLEPYASSLGSAFQKVNFLRDLKSDYQGLGRIYFPEVSIEALDEATKSRLVDDIMSEFDHALVGIRGLPKNSRLGVYLCYRYYRILLKRIQSCPPSALLQRRIRIPNWQKYLILTGAYLKYTFGRI